MPVAITTRSRLWPFWSGTPTNKRSYLGATMNQMQKSKTFLHCFLAIVVIMTLFDGVKCQGDTLPALAPASPSTIACLACGLPDISGHLDAPNNINDDNENNNMLGRFNESCEQLLYSSSNEQQAFIRACPVGVKSCFDATGIYRNEKNEKLIKRYLGCSEAKYEHDFGCDTETQMVDVPDMRGQLVTAEVEVRLCFCSDDSCNHPAMKTFSMASGIRLDFACILVFAIYSVFVGLKNSNL